MLRRVVGLTSCLEVNVRVREGLDYSATMCELLWAILNSFAVTSLTLKPNRHELLLFRSVATNRYERAHNKTYDNFRQRRRRCCSFVRAKATPQNPIRLPRRATVWGDCHTKPCSTSSALEQQPSHAARIEKRQSKAMEHVIQSCRENTMLDSLHDSFEKANETRETVEAYSHVTTLKCHIDEVNRLKLTPHY